MGSLRKPVMVLVVVGACIAIVSTIGLASKHYNTEPGSEPDMATIPKDYRTWTRVNAEPYRMSAAVAAQCAAATPGQMSPHLDIGAYVNVYVNEKGRAAMLQPGRVVFPEGTLIVKEKLLDSASSDPVLLTVMRKRAKGYNPEIGDWEFAVLDGKAQTIQANGKLGNCMQCHKAARASDFVFRT
ncbi:MAG: cytochrome P460 family protein, partial [Blastocatellia bacterium]